MNPAQRRLDLAQRAAPRWGQWLRREEAIMGTACSVELWCEDRRAGADACEAVLAEMRRIDRAMSPHRDDSELSRINRDAARGPVPLSDEMARLLAQALAFSKVSAGAFDLSYAAVGALYDYRAGIAPDETALARARESVGWQHLHFDAAQRTLRFGKPGMRIDLGGFAKGHAVDCAARLLRRRGIAHAHVAAGGDSRVVGDRRGRPWTIGIRDPRREREIVALLPLADCAISTSGDYERFFVRDGVRHHHIVDPATGRSPGALTSVTVLAPDGLAAEALGKCVFVLGPERGIALAESFAGVDVVAVDAEGRLHRSAGLLDAAAIAQ